MKKKMMMKPKEMMSGDTPEHEGRSMKGGGKGMMDTKGNMSKHKGSKC